MRVGDEPAVQTLSVMGDYFRVMQIPVVAGRGLTEQDREGQPLVAVVSEEMVRKFFPNENPLGARIDWARKDQPHQWMTIVGVVRDVKHTELERAGEAAVYAPFAQMDEAWRRWMSLAVRTQGPCGGIGGGSEAAGMGGGPADPGDGREVDGGFDAGVGGEDTGSTCCCWECLRDWRLCWRRWGFTGRWRIAWGSEGTRSGFAWRWGRSGGMCCGW